MTALEETTLIQKARNQAEKAGRFFWHFLQMALVMEAGMQIYMKLIIPRLVPFGFPQLRLMHPLFCYWLMVASMTLPMIALMRLYHKSSWRYTLEMTAAMLAPLTLLSALVYSGLCQIQILFRLGDPLMFVAMAIFLLFRPTQHAHCGLVQT